MKKAMLGGVAALALASAACSAYAADLPPRVPVYTPPVVPLYSWTGFYMGVHFGWATTRTDWTMNTPIANNAAIFNADGIMGGGQMGYNFQSGNFLWGIEADFSTSDQDGAGLQTITPSWTSATKINWFGSMAGRLGYVWDRALIYFKGGFAWAQETHQQSLTLAGNTNPIIISGLDTFHTGWVAGVGVEVALWDNFTAKVEYNYFDLGTESLNFVNTSLGTTNRGALFDNFDIDQRFHLIKFGVNYRWGGWR
jgi:outer membrane immunogenic protein